jgi:ADP-heptose:LPS heptosyltransferase
MTGGRVLVARPDSLGDVLLSGPAIRAVAASAAETVLLCGPRGRAAGRLLPGVDRLVEWRVPWIDPEPDPVDRAGVERFVATIRDLGTDEAIVLTSFHQSALPLALLLRLAGVPRIVAISEDYPGSLLDVRHRDPGDVPEPERALSVVAAAGYRLPPDDDGTLRVRPDLPDVSGLVPESGYVALHPGTSVPARAWPAERCVQAVQRLVEDGFRVVVTGAPDERRLTAMVAGRFGLDLGGRTDLAQLAAVLAGAGALVVGNTGPAHLAAAVGTPVVSLFAPTVPAARWAPYGVPSVLLGDQSAPCRGTRATACPVPGHPCLSGVTPDDVARAVEKVTGGPL